MTNGDIIGIDIGLIEFYIDSNGAVINNPNNLNKYNKSIITKISQMFEMNIDHFIGNTFLVNLKPLN